MDFFLIPFTSGFLTAVDTLSRSIVRILLFNRYRTKSRKKGQIFACGTCLKIRQMKGSEVCPISTIHNILHIVKESDKVLVFG
jgi:hypothetical protein